MIGNIIGKMYKRLLRRKQHLSLLNLSSPSYISPTAVFSFHKNIFIGKYCRIGNGCHVDGEGGVKIGEGTILASNVVLLSSSHDYKQEDLLPYGFDDVKLPIVIGKGCWIGWGAMVRPGVTIGDGVVVAMGTVVTKDIPAGTLVAGNPGQVIKSIRSPEHLNLLIRNEKFYLKEVAITGRRRSGRGTMSFDRV